MDDPVTGDGAESASWVCCPDADADGAACCGAALPQAVSSPAAASAEATAEATVTAAARATGAAARRPRARPGRRGIVGIGRHLVVIE